MLEHFSSYYTYTHLGHGVAAPSPPTHLLAHTRYVREAEKKEEKWEAAEGGVFSFHEPHPSLS